MDEEFAVLKIGVGGTYTHEGRRVADVWVEYQGEEIERGGFEEELEIIHLGRSYKVIVLSSFRPYFCYDKGYGGYKFFLRGLNVMEDSVKFRVLERDLPALEMIVRKLNKKLRLEERSKIKDRNDLFGSKLELGELEDSELEDSGIENLEKSKSIIISELLKMKSTNTDEVIRYSGLHASKPETLSKHLIEMQLVCIKLAQEFIEKYDYNIDLGKLCLKALLHDIDEVVTGDFPRPIKYWSKELHDNIEELSKESLIQLLESEYRDSNQLYNLWAESKKEIEGIIVKAADIILVAKKAVEEVFILKNLYFYKVLEEVRIYLREISDAIRDSGAYRLIADYLDKVEAEVGYYLSIVRDREPKELLESLSYESYYQRKED